MRLLILALSISCLGFAQTPAPPAPPAPAPSLLSQVTDPAALVLVSYGVSQIAESTTDWHFSAAGKKYSVSPAQRAAWAGGLGFATIAIQHYAPKTKKWVELGTGVLSAYLAGRAYANTLTHGTLVTPAGTKP
jgi:hypothetical protein